MKEQKKRNTLLALDLGFLGLWLGCLRHIEDWFDTLVEERDDVIGCRNDANGQ
jgi:hypothetical protein